MPAAYTRDRFRDAAGVLATYSFHINHNEEDGVEHKRNIERSSTTSAISFVRQQGEDSPQVFRFQGHILHQAQHDAMLNYFKACRTRTVFFRDGITGVEYEVIVTSFVPRRRRTLRNPRDSANAELHWYEYTLEMEVV